MKIFVRSCFILSLLMLVALGAGCSRQARLANALQSADRFYESGEFTSAEVEYLNALKLDAQNSHAIGRLGLVYSEQGRMGRAIAYLRKSYELQPADLDLRVKLAQLALATGNLKDAQEHANFVLEHRPTDPDAPQLLVASMMKPEECDPLRKRLLNLPAAAAKGAPSLAAQGGISLRQGRLDEAEGLIKQALAADPKFATAHTVLGTLYLARADVNSAAEAFKHAAEFSPARSASKLQYAQFVLQNGNLPAGKQLLTEITKKAPDFVPAWIAMAEVALTEKNFPECNDFVGRALDKDPGNLDALLLAGRLQIAKGDLEPAIANLEKLTAAYPKSPATHFILGRAFAASGEVGRAIDQLNQAVNLAPAYADAVLQLSSLYIRKGDPRSAITLLRKLIPQRPDLTHAQLLLAEAYHAQGDLDAQLTIYQQIEKQFPKNGQIPLLLGGVLAQQRKNNEAREAFTRAYAMMPESALALEQLINLDLIESKFQDARERVDAALAKTPQLAGPGQLLIAKIFLAQKDFPGAEAALKKSIELSPDVPTAYFLLAGIYNTTNQQTKALASLEQAAAHSPKDTTALMMIGIISEQQKSFTAARDAYLKILAINPKSSGALNNLAYLDAEEFGQLDQAYDLAQRARELQPDEPHVADTLGWILYRKHQYPRALILLQESAEKMPDSAVIQYHLGMAHYMMGAEDPARTSLQEALKSGTEFTGRDEAKQSLAVLTADLSRTPAEIKQALELTIAGKKTDPVALARLGAIYEQEGNRDRAIAAYESALLINGKNLNVLLSLARLYDANKNRSKAMDAAKAARKQSPDDPEVAHVLGNLAYETGDYPWAASLLQEAARKEPDSPALLFDLAQALYSLGQVPDTITNLRRAIQLDGAFSRSTEAKRFLEFIAPETTSAQAGKISTEAESVLKSTPNYVPALMVSASLNEKQQRADAAQHLYEKVLAIFPDFLPAKIRLAVLGASKSAFDQKAYLWAVQARALHSDDIELTKALGVLTYRKGDFPRATALLNEAVVARKDDAEAWYYLGMSQYRQKAKVESRRSLERALDLGLAPELSTEARKLIAEMK